MLSRSDEPSFQVDDIVDAIEAGWHLLAPEARSRVILDPNSSDERGAVRQSYLGSAVAVRTQAQLRAGPIAAGAAIQKDAWERSYADDWAGYVETTGPFSVSELRAEHVVLGNYRLAFGSGLIFGSGLTGILLRVDPARNPVSAFGVRHSMSPHAASPLLGAAVDLRFRGITLLPFVSHNSIDARIDSVGARTLYGYLHRTSTEESYRHTLGSNTLGAHLSYRDSDELELGVTYSHVAFDAPLATTSSKLQKGSHLTQVGSDLRWRIADGATASAEIASSTADSSSGLGYIVSLETQPTHFLRAFAAVHHQDTAYFSPHGSIVGETEGDLSNGEGVWLGVGSTVADCCSLLAGIDYSRTLDRQALDAGEKKLEAFLETRVTPDTRVDIAARFRYRTSVTAASTRVDSQDQENLRVIARWLPTQTFTMTLRTEGTIVTQDNSLTKSTGGFVQLDASLRQKGYTLRSTVARFSSDDYDSRVYSYTSEVYGYGSILLLYGRGYYAGVSARVRAAEWLTVEGHAGGYLYDHTRAFGSGVTERHGANDVDVVVQVTVGL